MTSAFIASARPTEHTPLIIPEFPTIPCPTIHQIINCFKRAINFLTCGAYRREQPLNGEAAEPVNERTKVEAPSLMNCQICYDDEIPLERSFFCMQSCVFCDVCTKTGINTRIGDGEISFPCFLQCGSEISYDTIKKVLPDAAYKKLIQKIGLDEVTKVKIKGLETCPRCNFAMILPRHLKTFSCMNEECRFQSCRLCKKAPHEPIKCDQVEYDEDVKRRTYVENKMTEALTRTCYKCKKIFIKTEGCNKMKCNCGAIMCYLCRKPIDGYEHFQGGKCKLFTDDAEINLNSILKNAERAKQSFGNVKLKKDPTRDIRKYYKK